MGNSRLYITVEAVLKSLQAALAKGVLPNKGDRAGVALSGGADSVGALIVLQNLAVSGGFSLTVLHVNHGLRGAESDADESFAAELARRLGISIRIERLPPAPGNLEQAARNARYAWFRQLIRSGQLDKVATGHTRSDQAETVLFRFLRGSGTAGLAGILPATDDGIIRPLLHVSREEIRKHLTLLGIPWREDSSNVDDKFARNRIRHQLLPALTRDWNPALPEILSHTAEWARAEEEYWAAEIRRLAAGCVRLESGAAILSAPEIATLPLAAARRIVRFAIGEIKGDLRGVDFAHIEQILGLTTHGRAQVPGLQVRRSWDWIRISRAGPVPSPYRHPLPIPGRIAVPGRRSLQFELQSADNVYNKGGHQLDWERITGSLELRNWHPGDHYRRAGHSSEIKLKLLFQKARVPAWERCGWPVITCGESIVWAGGFGPAADVACSSTTRTILVVREIPADFGETPNQNV